ncbi:hypothetical protein [Hephaestia caeni]|uniref:hypothetical protein n=1 Tax=Hephaestia caeni TaxID=645617 RepID=UPI0011C374FB|nr:hypothetical protein [Hephaestia caeni]
MLDPGLRRGSMQGDLAATFPKRIRASVTPDLFRGPSSPKRFATWCIAEPMCVVHVSLMDIRSIGLILLGVLLLVWPTLVARRLVDRHERRLGELQRGEKEEFFEERRSLETYAPLRRLWVLRLLGLMSLLVGAGSLVFAPH